jgi:F-type H+-transporting ATPase subunit b
MENLGLDPKLIVAQLVNFAIFFYVFARFIAKPFMEYVKKQKGVEKEREKLIEGLRVREAEIEKEKEQILAKAKEEARALLSEAKEEAQMMMKEASDKAQAQAEEIIAKAKADIERMKKDAEKEMQQQVINTSMVLLNKGLEEYLTDESRKTITKYILENSSKALKA